MFTQGEFQQTFNQYVQNQNGPALAKLLSLDVLNQIKWTNGKPKVTAQWQDVVNYRIAAVFSRKDDDMQSCFKNLESSQISFQHLLQDETRWILDVVYLFVLDLRDTAIVSGKMEQAARVLMKDFSLTFNDKAPLAQSRKWGTLFVVNALVRMYFKMNNLRLCQNLIRAIESPGFPGLNKFPMSQHVTYKYYVGRISLFDGNYDRAHDYLNYVYTHTPDSYWKSKRAALVYLIPIKLLRCELPTRGLLLKYRLSQFSGIVESIRTGNLGLFSSCLEQNQEFFISKGCYLSLEKLRVLVHRNLFRNIHLILASASAKPNLVPVGALTHCHNAIYPDMHVTDDEVECLLANLIFQRLIKGYISREQRTLVVARDGAFPSVKGHRIK